MWETRIGTFLRLVSKLMKHKTMNFARKDEAIKFVAEADECLRFLRGGSMTSWSEVMVFGVSDKNFLKVAVIQNILQSCVNPDTRKLIDLQ